MSSDVKNAYRETFEMTSINRGGGPGINYYVASDHTLAQGRNGFGLTLLNLKGRSTMAPNAGKRVTLRLH